MFTAQIKYKHLYTCSYCSFSQLGETQSIELKGNITDSIDTAKLPFRNSSMPVGWASFHGEYSDLFKCHHCLKEKPWKN